MHHCFCRICCTQWTHGQCHLRKCRVTKGSSVIGRGRVTWLLALPTREFPKSDPTFSHLNRIGWRELHNFLLLTDFLSPTGVVPSCPSGCASNPCRHNAPCRETEEFSGRYSCDCSLTSYAGRFCDTGKLILCLLRTKSRGGSGFPRRRWH